METNIQNYTVFPLQLFLAEGYVSSFSPKDAESCDGPPRDVTDASQTGDVTDSGFRSLAQKRPSFRRKRRLSSSSRSERRTWYVYITDIM